MLDDAERFAPLNRAYADTFRPGRLSVGLVVPIDAYPDARAPEVADHVARIRLAERLGFAAIWLRDVPFDVPSFGDAGQVLDPFVLLGALAALTDRIALGVASLILPLRHPAHVAKAAASVDTMSGGRLLLGVASGDRPEEYPTMGADHAGRGDAFRAAFDYVRRMADPFPVFENAFGAPDGRGDLRPKPVAGRLPMLITGGSQQSSDWGAANADGLITYPRAAAEQARALSRWRDRIPEGQSPKPVMQPLYVDLVDDPDAPATPLHLGFRSGIRPLAEYLRAVRAAGVNHVALNLRFNRAPIERTLERLAADLLPLFHDGDDA
ncbi:LLM class oxidoreductase [uncultured Jannaschia sp.]|uniref:LLM class oxidoreductase n=1 Tax=uncultured Jannaschia sp. TaxID=293347 RepID=UPI002609BA8E|nr:LLM class oxidoreductase [uncultured Jannaschia sp.]